MPNPILASDVIIRFSTGGDFFNYGCATELEIDFAMETKSVKTVGDGAWKRFRGQSKEYKINLSGIIKSDADVPDAFDLLDYFKNMVDINYQMLFSDETGVVKVIEGYALPTSVNLGGGAEGHANGSIVLQGNGDPDGIYAPPDPGGPITECEAQIEAAHTELIGDPFTRRYMFIDSMVAGSATISRWDYTVDGGGTETAFTDGNIPTSWLLPLITNTGSHTVIVTPICDNGFSGTPFTVLIS